MSGARGIRTRLQQMHDAQLSERRWGRIVLELTEPRYDADGKIVDDGVEIIVTDDDDGCVS